MPDLDLFTLTDGGQSAEEVARRVAAFIEPAERSLDLALYDVRLPDPAGAIVAEALRAAAGRGVAVRLIYNVDVGRPAALHPPPSTRPDILEQLPIETRAVSGIPDLMHHKYAVRDLGAVWTGSANWTTDSWTRQENVLATVSSERSGATTPPTSVSSGSAATSSARDSPTPSPPTSQERWCGHGSRRATGASSRSGSRPRSARRANGSGSPRR